MLDNETATRFEAEARNLICGIFQVQWQLASGNSAMLHWMAKNTADSFIDAQGVQRGGRRKAENLTTG